MTKNEELDYVILFLKHHNVDNRLVSSLDFPTSKNFDIPEIEDALDKLVGLGYAGKNPEGGGYWLNFDGRQIIENTPKVFKNKPFAYQDFKSKLAIAWTAMKTFGLILNALAILLLMFWSIKVTDKSKAIEEERDKLKKEVAKQSSVIDSLKLEINRPSSIEKKGEKTAYKTIRTQN